MLSTQFSLLTFFLGCFVVHCIEQSFPDGIILDAKYYYRRGVISVSLKDPEEAVSCLNEALKLNPTDPMIAKKLKEAKL